MDYGYYLHASIYAWRNRKMTPATYTCITMLLGDLRKVGVDRDDIVIIAVDKGRSWRKDKDSEYKSSRKAKKKKQKDIPWKDMYASFDKLLDQLDAYTPWHVIELWSMEADDIISYGVRYFKDKRCVICSVDSDFEQLFALDNVQIYSPHPKRKCYKEPPKNPASILAKKIQKEVSDDLISPVLTDEDYNRRHLIINLMKLPDDIEKRIEEQIKFLPTKEFEINKLPFRNLHSRFENIYEKDKVITFEKSMQRLERKKEKKKKEKKDG
ncbi:hypothetical protein LCGC14_1938500 [marine sediment metagenome]|uniref:5'-3' exonuclease alpha-helical arch N-terminal domain-containing protein n=1 Tax=marine sediment metagenome TaxID=412755 RepID=A0A0F9IID2_9ZZZZ